MAKLKYISEYPVNNEAKEIEFKFDDDLDIYELRILFIRMAHAMGYGPNSILNAFGPIDSSTEDIDDFFIQIRKIDEDE